jgi:CubicO group peptidase (beta-lactamase class C family)
MTISLFFRRVTAVVAALLLLVAAVGPAVGAGATGAVSVTATDVTAEAEDATAGDATAGASPTAGAGFADDAALEAFFDEQLAAGIERFHAPGAVVVVVRDGEPVLAKGYGVANVETGEPMTPDAVVAIGSVGRVVTATAAVQIVEAGRLDLDADVNDYLVGSPVRVPETGDGPITARHFGTHTAGFDYHGFTLLGYLNEGRYGGAQLVSPAGIATLHGRQFANAPDSGLPGVAYGYAEYDSLGVDAVGKTGDTAEFSTDLVLLPGEDVGYFVAYTSNGGAQARVVLRNAFLTRYADPGAVAAANAPYDGPGSAVDVAGTYATGRVSLTSHEKLLGVFTTTYVAVDEHTLAIEGAPAGLEFVEVRPGVFRQPTYGMEIAAFAATLVHFDLAGLPV